MQTAIELSKEKPGPGKIAAKPVEKREVAEASEDSDTLKGVESINDEEVVVNKTQQQKTDPP